jgi:hypothetical protein
MHRRGQKWTIEEDNQLRQQILQFGKQWSAIASNIPNRTATQIAARWEKCIDPKLTKGTFTREEDQVIRSFVQENGTRSWPKITRALPHRTPKQCRERWFNNLDPSVVKDPWTCEEDRRIFEAYIANGPKWSVIAHELPGRTDNAIKNRWNASISKRLRIVENGEQILGPSKVRKYSRRKVGNQAKHAGLPAHMIGETEMGKKGTEIDPMDLEMGSADLASMKLEEPMDGAMVGGGRDFGTISNDGTELGFF